jgi:lysozyme family protein
MQIPGAFLLRYPPGEGRVGHIVISAGDCSTVEAADSTRGVIAGSAAGRRWDIGVLLPGVEYDGAAAGLPPIVRAEALPNPDPRVTEIQLALEAKGFDPGPIDGLYGEQTQAAVASFQAANGLIVDGEVGPQTRETLLGGQAGATPAGIAAPVAMDAAPTIPSTSGKYEDVREEYLALFATLTSSADATAKIEAATDRVVGGKSRCQAVASNLGAIPWYVIGVINELESTSNFNAHLHNGDPLTRRTVHVPAGRPPTGSPPFTWEASAEDALRMKNYHTMSDWRLSRILHRLEGYNGLGFRRHGIFTPYLWSGCQHYSRGKYVADGVWDPNAVSKQIGCGVILHQLQSRGEISLDLS